MAASYKRGDIIRNVGSGLTYVVVDIVDGNVIAARTIAVSNMTEIEGDLRQLALWIDSVLSGNSPHVEHGS